MTGSSCDMSLLPCGTCPWRKSSTVGGRDIPGFSIVLMRRLKNTVGKEDGFYAVMACHYSTKGNDIPCRGYLAVEGYRNINVRLMVLQGKFSLMDIQEACEQLDLWPSFHEMLAAYEKAHEEFYSG